MPKIISMQMQPNAQMPGAVGMHIPMVLVQYDDGTSKQVLPQTAGFTTSSPGVWEPPAGMMGQGVGPNGGGTYVVDPGNGGGGAATGGGGGQLQFGGGTKDGGQLQFGGGANTGTTTTTAGQQITGQQQITNQVRTGQSTTNNLDPDSQAALTALISTLQGGGSDYTRSQKAARQGEISNVQGMRAGYTKDAAFADAQGAMQGQVRQVLEKLMPSITRAAEGAGTSRNSMRALMINDAATRASEAAAALGLKAAVDYGNVGANYSQVLANLTNADDPAVNALIGALNVAKGANVTTNTTDTTTGTVDTSGFTNTNQISNTNGGSGGGSGGSPALKYPTLNFGGIGGGAIGTTAPPTFAADGGGYQGGGSSTAKDGWVKIGDKWYPPSNTPPGDIGVAGWGGGLNANGGKTPLTFGG